MDFLSNHVEALIFCAPKPISEEEIQSCLREMFEAEIPAADIADALQKIGSRYESEEFSFGLVKSGGGYQFLTKPAYQASIAILLRQQSKKRLSTSAMETLAIIAYRQPMTKSAIEQIRGVNCDYAIQKLLEKELIELRGKSDAVGRPMLYGTSARFMDYFGINDLKDLPSPRDFVMDENTIGKVEE